jgi:hypothetical protein
MQGEVKSGGFKPCRIHPFRPAGEVDRPASWPYGRRDPTLSVEPGTGRLFVRSGKVKQSCPHMRLKIERLLMTPDPKDNPETDDAEAAAMEEVQEEAAEERKEGGYQ